MRENPSRSFYVLVALRDRSKIVIVKSIFFDEAFLSATRYHVPSLCFDEFLFFKSTPNLKEMSYITCRISMGY